MDASYLPFVAVGILAGSTIRSWWREGESTTSDKVLDIVLISIAFSLTLGSKFL